MVRSAAALILTTLASSSLAADSPAGLSQGMDYAAAREVVLRQGWQTDATNPLVKNDLQQSLQAYFIGRGFSEVETCLPTGLGTCTARFHDTRGRSLFLFTGEPSEDGAQLSSWCLDQPDPKCRPPARR